ncbi:MAG: cobalamin biosynthesis protein CobD [Erythrobacter sp.]|nr:cobalamin biosynthesis protein CobD [Erythrobacter sp.]
MTAAWIMLGGLVLEAFCGWPDRLDKRIGHPVRWFGWLVTRAERLLNRENSGRAVRILLGGMAALFMISIAASAGLAIEVLAPSGVVGLLIQSVVAASLIAGRSLNDHVAAVAQAFARNGLPAARSSLSKIVGRETHSLNEQAIARAAIESLAENTSDGVTAPLFWGAMFGLPGLFAYKAINTLDSMIGHRNAQYEAFGKIAARIDDIANFGPARLTGFLFGLVSGSARSFRIMVRDASCHRSINAGWPEAAMAGALDIRLSGPRCYGDGLREEPWLNADGRDPPMHDLAKALSIYRRSVIAMGLTLFAVGGVVSL